MCKAKSTYASPMFHRRILPSTLLAIVLASASVSSASPLQPGEILVADRQSGLLVVDPATGATAPFSHSTDHYHFDDVVVGPAGNLYVVEAGEIDKVDPSTGAVTLVLYSPNFWYSSHLDVSPDGNVIVEGTNSTNGLVKVNPTSGTETVIAPDLHVAAFEVVDASTAYVVGWVPGFDFYYAYRVNLATGDTTRVSSVPFQNPTGLAIEPSGSFVVVDENGLHRVFPGIGAVAPIASNPADHRWEGVAIEADGDILVTGMPSDPNCRRPPVTCFGQVDRVDPISGTFTKVSSDHLLYSIFGIDVYGASGVVPVRTTTWSRLKILYR